MIDADTLVLAELVPEIFPKCIVARLLGEMAEGVHVSHFEEPTKTLARLRLEQSRFVTARLFSRRSFPHVVDSAGRHRELLFKARR